MTNLNLKINNFGPIKEGNIEIGKINIIAGPNASGKTTASKLLYCLVSSVSSDGEYLTNSNLKNRLSQTLHSFSQTLPLNIMTCPKSSLDLEVSLRGKALN